MKPTEREKLQFGIEIVAAMFAERLYNGDLDAGMADALSETEIDRLGFSKEDLESMPEDRQELIIKMAAFHKTRLHQQAMFMANTVLSSGLISRMQPEWVAVSEKETRLKEGDKAWIEMDFSAWGRNEKRVTIADVWFTKEPRGYGGPNALTGSGMLTGIYFSLPAIVNPDCVKRFCLIPQPPKETTK
jgi:hypothetical protein